MKELIFAACLVATLPAWATDFIPLERQTARSLADPQQHRQPTVVALWSSDCTHCKKNFDLFAAMARSEKRLRIITVATEAPSPTIASLLEKHKVPGVRYAYGNDTPEALAYALDPAWTGELPRTLLFDGKGRVVKRSGVLKPDETLRAVALR